MAADISLEEQIKFLLEKNSQLTQERDEARQQVSGLTLDQSQLAQELAEARQQITPLTFTKLLTLCHQEIGQVRVESDRSICTTRHVGDPHDNLIPLAVRSWTEFPKLQESTFSKVNAVYDHCKEPPKSFPSSDYIVNGLKRKSRPLASELDLWKQQVDCVENFIETIIRDLIVERELPAEFGLGTDIHLDNRANNLNKDEETALVTKIAKSADKIFIRKIDGGQKRLVLIIEYKPPHKLSLATLKAVLKDLDPLELIHRVTIPNDKTEKSVEESEATVAIVLAQVYTYLIDSGIQYAYLTTGEAFVFLYLQDHDRNILYYHMVIPGDVPTTGTANWIPHTAIGQVLSFYILACGGKFYDQNSRQRHRRDALKWVKDGDKLIANMTPSPQKPPTPSFEYKAFSKSHAPAHSQSGTGRRLRSSASGETPPLNVQVKKDDSDDSSDGGDSGAPSDPFASASTRASRASKGTQSQSANKASQTQNETLSSSRKRDENYCSHQCLLGLATKGALDPSCPNYEFHPRVKKGRGKARHAISVVQLRELLLAQLQETMNDNIEPLGIQGARGAIFKLTLESHGYTMIGKGTPPHYVPYLRTEKAVYDHLHEIQGRFIPVCLGAIDSPRRYFYDVGVAIFHWLLLSFAGQSLKLEEFQAREAGVDELRDKLMHYGIRHPDISPNNILWDDQAQRLMMIDFEGLKFATKKGKDKVVGEEKTSGLLKEMSPNKMLRKRKATGMGEGVVVRPAKVQVR